jgi:anthranilate phosphoribosyltransferase
MGVADVALAEKMGAAALGLGYERLLIVTSEDGLDEISLCAKTHLFDVHDGTVTRSVIDPTAHGFALANKSDLAGGDATENAALLKAILAGEHGPNRDVVVLNSAYALLVAGKAADVADGIRQAERSIDSGSAQRVLTQLIEETNTPTL